MISKGQYLFTTVVTTFFGKTSRMKEGKRSYKDSQNNCSCNIRS